jgi:hypothetical protein
MGTLATESVHRGATHGDHRARRGHFVVKEGPEGQPLIPPVMSRASVGFAVLSTLLLLRY